MKGEQNTANERPKPKHYKDLLVWQKGMNLAKLVYKLTVRFPSEERYGLTSQMRRSAVSVPSNIAEGQARRGTNEFLQFELGFAQQLDVESSLKEIDELQKMLVALKRKLSSYSPLATRHSPLSQKAR
jgi:hypothetical protein